MNMTCDSLNKERSLSLNSFMVSEPNLYNIQLLYFFSDGLIHDELARHVDLLNLHLHRDSLHPSNIGIMVLST
jgi:hypothetical protein